MQRFCIRSNGLDYPLEKKCHPFERLWLSVRKRIVIPSNDLGYPGVREKLSSVRTTRAIRWKKLSSFRTARAIRSKNRHPFERLNELSIKNNCQPRYCSKPLLLPKPFATNLSKNVSSNNSSKRCLSSPHKFSRYIFC